MGLAAVRINLLSGDDAMFREFGLPVAFLFCVLAQLHSLRAEAQPPAAKADQQTLSVRLVDADGRPVEGARVGTFARFADFTMQSKYFVPDESGWSSYPKTLSDRDGMARLTDSYDITLVVAWHAGKKLVGIESIRPRPTEEPVKVTMYPACKVFGRLTSKELAARHKNFTWSNVYLYLKDDRKRPMSCESRKGEFHFYVPPGTYKLRAYSAETHCVERAVTVKPGQTTLEIDPIDMRATRLALLGGEPAPELQDVAAWKNSEPLKLADLRGKVVLLEFWGHWCGPCVGRMPDVFAVYDKYRDKGLVVIGVHVDRGFGVDSVAKLDEKLADVKKRLWKGRDIPFPVALVVGKKPADASGAKTRRICPLVDQIYDITGYPTGVLIDRRGRVIREFSAGYEPDEPILEKAIADK
jgi:thiol-disulfide isomerase/thioredoxin